MSPWWRLRQGRHSWIVHSPSPRHRKFGRNSCCMLQCFAGDSGYLTTATTWHVFIIIHLGLQNPPQDIGIRRWWGYERSINIHQHLCHMKWHKQRSIINGICETSFSVLEKIYEDSFWLPISPKVGPGPCYRSFLRAFIAWRCLMLLDVPPVPSLRVAADFKSASAWSASPWRRCWSAAAVASLCWSHQLGPARW